MPSGLAFQAELELAVLRDVALEAFDGLLHIVRKPLGRRHLLTLHDRDRRKDKAKNRDEKSEFSKIHGGSVRILAGNASLKSETLVERTRKDNLMNAWISTFLIGLASVAIAAAEDSVYDFTVRDIAGKEVELKGFSDKVLLIVNVASQCGSTYQYSGMEALHQHFEDKGLIVMGFPTNDFGGQEPGSNKEIQAFCQANFAVSFPMFSKVAVSGDEQIPLFRYLTVAENPDGAGPIGWNFEKILVGKDGKVIRRFKSYHEPDGEEIVSAIEAALAAP